MTLPDLSERAKLDPLLDVRALCGVKVDAMGDSLEVSVEL